MKFGPPAGNHETSAGKDGPRMPLPDFFIGAHAAALAVPVITNDPGRLKTYFPNVELVAPSD